MAALGLTRTEELSYILLLRPHPCQLAVFLTQSVVAESLFLAGLGLLCAKTLPGECQE